MKRVAVIMGSASDLPIAEKAVDTLKTLGIPHAVRVLSAHRTQEAARAFALSASQEGFGVLIAFAGMAAHLAGALAAASVLPVIGVPVSGKAFGGMDALLSTVQMPSGIPVATVAADGGKNAALLAAEILAVSDEDLTEKLMAMRVKMQQEAEEKDREISLKYMEGER